MHDAHIPLLAKIASMLTGRIEDVAAEAFGHVFADSQSARDVLSDVLRTGNEDVGVIADTDSRPSRRRYKTGSSSFR